MKNTYRYMKIYINKTHFSQICTHLKKKLHYPHMGLQPTIFNKPKFLRSPVLNKWLEMSEVNTFIQEKKDVKGEKKKKRTLFSCQPFPKENPPPLPEAL